MAKYMAKTEQKWLKTDKLLTVSNWPNWFYHLFSKASNVHTRYAGLYRDRGATPIHWIIQIGIYGDPGEGQG